MAEAEELYRKATGANPAFVPAHTNLGRMLCALNRAAEAAAEFDAALNLLPANAPVRAEIETLRANCPPVPAPAP